MKRPWRVLLPFMRRQRGALAVAALSSVVAALADLAAPWPLKFAIDHLFNAGTAPGGFALQNDDLVFLAGIAGLVLAIALVTAVADYAQDIFLIRAGERIIHDLRIATYEHLQRLSLAYHERRPTGDLVTRVTGDVNAVGDLFSSTAGTVVTAVVSIIGMVVIGVLIDPVLALAAFCTTPVLAILAFRFRRRVRTLARTQRTMEGEIAAMSTEALGSMREVKAFASEGFEYGRLERKSDERRQAGFQSARVEGRFARAIDLLGAVGTSLVLVAGVFRVSRGALSPGELLVMVAYTHKIYKPLREIARESLRASRSLARADRVAEVLTSDELVPDGDVVPEGPARGSVVFDGVSFAYDKKRPVLEQLSLVIAPGEKVALVGRSGAGKSTVAALIARFYDPHEGRVLLDDLDMRTLSLEWARGQIGIVLQDSILFTGTVAENIAYGGPGLDRGRIVAAAKAAGAHSFIAELPDGYDTELGQHGVALSGGQRQRISVARTLLRNPSVLILDEPTTGLDAEAEAQVLDGLDVLMRGRTTVIITHSPALARSADRVVVLDSGTVIEEGDPTALLAANSTLLDEDRLPLGGRRGRIPADPALPEMGRLLDPAAMAPVLARSLGRETPFPDVRVQYLRYKPGTSLVAHYHVGLDYGWYDAVAMVAAGADLARRAAKPENSALAAHVNGRSPSATPLVYDEESGALIQWLPLDLSMPALGASPQELAAWMADAGARGVEPVEPLLLAYKPRRRAVLRVGKHIVKIYAAPDRFALACEGLFAAGSLPALVTPQPEGALVQQRLTVQGLLAGRPPSDAGAVAPAAGWTLADLHHSNPRGNLPEFGPLTQLDAAAASAVMVGALLPSLAPRLSYLLERLSRNVPDSGDPVLSHGDFHAGQLLETGGVFAVIDFDSMCVAPAALDIATYVAHTVRGDEGDLDRAGEVLARIIDGYGTTPDALRWYLVTALLRRAPFPFRYLDDQWPERIEAMLDMAEETMRR